MMTTTPTRTWCGRRFKMSPAASAQARSMSARVTPARSTTSPWPAGHGRGDGLCLGQAPSVGEQDPEDHQADAHVSGSTNVATTGTTAPGVQIQSTDTSTIAALAGGVGIARRRNRGCGSWPRVSPWPPTRSTTPSTPTLPASKVTSAASDVELSATSSPEIKALTIGVAVGATGGAGGIAGSGAGSGSGNTIGSTTEAYITSSGGASLGVTANGGAVTLTATDNPTILSSAGSLAVGLNLGGFGGAAVSVSVSAATNDIANMVYAYVDGSNVTAAAHDVSLSANETATIENLTIGGSVGGSAGGGGGLGIGAAGAFSANTVKNVVQADVKDGAVISTTTSGDVQISATDNSSITANAGGVAIGFTAGGGGGGAVSLGVSSATDDIENKVQAFVTGS